MNESADQLRANLLAQVNAGLVLADATFERKHPRGQDGKFTRTPGGTRTSPDAKPARPHLTAADYEGTVGSKDHITRTEQGTIPLSAIARLAGTSGEKPGEHRNYSSAKWEQFKADIAAHGITNPIFITVDWGQPPRISEGNQRRDAALELGLTQVPVEIRYFGHAERQGTVWERSRI